MTQASDTTRESSSSFRAPGVCEKWPQLCAQGKVWVIRCNWGAELLAKALYAALTPSKTQGSLDSSGPPSHSFPVGEAPSPSNPFKPWDQTHPEQVSVPCQFSYPSKTTSGVPILIFWSLLLMVLGLFIMIPNVSLCPLHGRWCLLPPAVRIAS